MQANEIKNYLYEDPERIHQVLEHFEFHSINIHHDEIRCAVPGGSNKTSVAVKVVPELFATSYSDQLSYRGDLLGLIETSSGKDFGYVMREIHYIFAIPYKSANKKVDLLKGLRKYKKRGAKLEDRENVKYTPHKLDEFIHKQHKMMIEEAISPKVLDKFKICFDPRQSRIIIPHFDWIEHDKIVGLVGRHTEKDTDILKELAIPKYFNYIKGYEKTRNLFGYNHSVEHIQENKQIIIFESEKSVMKHHTIEREKGYSVSVGGHEILPVQVEFILKNTSIDTEIIIAFDKDIMTNQLEQEDINRSEGKQDLGELELLCKKFSKFRKTSYIMDKYNLIGEKDSPIDRGIKRWNYLLKHRIEVMN